jgi:CDGSH-type Zn-finger protein
MTVPHMAQADPIKSKVEAGKATCGFSPNQPYCDNTQHQFQG